MLSKRQKCYIIILSVLYINCATTFKIWEETDKFNPGVTKITSTGITIKNVQFFDTSFLIMRPSYLFSQEFEIFSLTFIYSGEYWAFFDRIAFLIDGEVLSYDEIITEDSHVGSDASIGEIIVIEISEELLKKIRSANTISLRVSGKRRVIDQDFSQEAIDNLNTFYSYILDFRKKNFSSSSYSKLQKVDEQNNIEDNFKSSEELNDIISQVHYLPIKNTAKNKYLLVLIDNNTPMRIGDEYKVVRNLGGTSMEDIKEIGFAKVLQVEDNKVALEYFLYDQNGRLLKSDIIKYR